MVRRQRARQEDVLELCEMVTLVKAHERATFARWPRIQTLTQFCKQIRVIDRAQSVLGPCGR